MQQPNRHQRPGQVHLGPVPELATRPVVPVVGEGDMDVHVVGDLRSVGVDVSGDLGYEIP